MRGDGANGGMVNVVNEPAAPGCNRRQFLNRSAQQAAGVAAGMVSLSAVASAELSSECVRLGVIGLRNQGKALIETLLAMPNAEVAALCDVDEKQFASILNLLSKSQASTPDCETDFRRLLDDRALDAVVIAAPDHWHAPMTLLAL